MDRTTPDDEELIAAIQYLEDNGYRFFEKNGEDHRPVMFLYSGEPMIGDLDERVSTLLHERAKRIPKDRFIRLTFKEE